MEAQDATPSHLKAEFVRMPGTYSVFHSKTSLLTQSHCQQCPHSFVGSTHICWACRTYQAKTDKTQASALRLVSRTGGHRQKGIKATAGQKRSESGTCRGHWERYSVRLGGSAGSTGFLDIHPGPCDNWSSCCPDCTLRSPTFLTLVIPTATSISSYVLSFLECPLTS